MFKMATATSCFRGVIVLNIAELTLQHVSVGYEVVVAQRAPALCCGRVCVIKLDVDWESSRAVCMASC